MTAKDASFKLRLDNITIFTTGVPNEPPLGFSNKPNIKFCQGALTCANTCVNTLYLSLGVASPEEFTYT